MHIDYAGTLEWKEMGFEEMTWKPMSLRIQGNTAWWKELNWRKISLYKLKKKWYKSHKMELGICWACVLDLMIWICIQGYYYLYAVSQVFKEKRMWGDNTVSMLGIRKFVYLKKNGRKKRELKKIWWKMLGRTSRGCGRVESINLMGKNT